MVKALFCPIEHKINFQQLSPQHSVNFNFSSGQFMHKKYFDENHIRIMGTMY